MQQTSAASSVFSSADSGLTPESQQKLHEQQLLLNIEHDVVLSPFLSEYCITTVFIQRLVHCFVN